MDEEEVEELREKLAGEFRSKKTSQFKILSILADQEWHCREHEYDHVNTSQIAGGGGIQGLENGTKKRNGFIIESENRKCDFCEKMTRHDKWTGERETGNAPTHLPDKLKEKILTYYGYTDVIEQRQRKSHKLVIDHRFPRMRWGEYIPSHDPTMSTKEIEATFQLLKKDEGGNHNLLKSRACEHCKKTGKRGTPFGIDFFYKGESEWDDDLPVKGAEAKKGCIGCGWYNFRKWRRELNQRI